MHSLSPSLMPCWSIGPNEHCSKTCLVPDRHFCWMEDKGLLTPQHLLPLQLYPQAQARHGQLISSIQQGPLCQHENLDLRPMQHSWAWGASRAPADLW